MVAVSPLYDWYTNPTSVPLSTVVVAFNESKAGRNTPQDVTEKEIGAAINSQLPTLVAAERVKRILRRIADKPRVPPSTTIDHFPVLPASPSGQKYWATNLDFMTGPKSGNRPYSIRIRESSYEK